VNGERDVYNHKGLFDDNLIFRLRYYIYNVSMLLKYLELMAKCRTVVGPLFTYQQVLCI